MDLHARVPGQHAAVRAALVPLRESNDLPAMLGDLCSVEPASDSRAAVRRRHPGAQMCCLYSPRMRGLWSETCARGTNVTLADLLAFCARVPRRLH